MGSDTRDDEHKVIRPSDQSGLYDNLVTLGVVGLLRWSEKTCGCFSPDRTCPLPSYLAMERIQYDRCVPY